MAVSAAIVGPLDQAQRMSLDEFDRAEVQGGFLYELSRGVIEVSNVPEPEHAQFIMMLKRLLHRYDADHPGKIYAIHGGGECKLLIAPTQSERHPDLAIYLTPPPNDPDVWSVWVPAIVIEVVSESSRERDYKDKPIDYATFGVPEYWLFDRDQNLILAHQRRRGVYVAKTIKAGEALQTSTLPGLLIEPGTVFLRQA